MKQERHKGASWQAQAGELQVLEAEVRRRVRERLQRIFWRWIGGGLALLLLVGLVAMRGHERGWEYLFCLGDSWVELRPYPTRKELWRRMCCDPRRSDRCAQQEAFVSFFVYARKRERKTLRQAGALRLSSLGRHVRFTGFREGFFRQPSELGLRFREGTRAVFCCHRLKPCTKGRPCGCSYDCNRETGG